MKKRNKDNKEKTKRGGWLKWFVLAFVGLMLIGALNSEGSDTTTTTDDETVEVSSEAEENNQEDRKSVV